MNDSTITIRDIIQALGVTALAFAATFMMAAI